MREELRKTLACCREKRCEDCPLMTTICDELRVDMVDIPEDLVTLIEEALEDQPAPEEAVEPEVEGDRWNWWYVCGECHAAVIDGQKRCNGCGKPISWRKL